MEKIYHIGVFGPPEVGKTTLTMQCCGYRVLDRPYEPTIEDTHLTSIGVDGDLCNVEFLDTGGSKYFDSLRDQWARDCEGIVFVYDISDVSTHRLVETQMSNLQLFLSNLYKQHPGTPKKPITLVGNQVNAMRRAVSEEDGHSLAKKHGATFWETSVRNTNGFKDVCVRLLREMGAGGEIPSCTTEDSTMATKQPQADWVQSILGVLKWVPGWVCGIDAE